MNPRPWALVLLVSLIARAPASAQDDPELPASLRDKSLQLLERDDSGRLFGVKSSSAGKKFQAPGIDEFKGEFSQDEWNQIRGEIEEGTFLEDTPSTLDYSDLVPEPIEEPAPPPPEIDLPTYGTSLSVTGRKKIGLSFESKRFIKDQTKNTRPQSTNTFDIEQELQIRMQGKVGPKITVNVDFDDTREDKQDISVVYTGDANETVQSAQFGDIDLSLPSTEFVSYNKQLFGIRVELKVKQKLDLTFIGSRTKGVTKTRQFSGNTQFQSKDILDTQYDRRRYYDLTFGNPNRLPLQPGSELVFLDVQNAASIVNADVFDLTVRDLEVQSSSYTGKFVRLAAGRDYTIDYNEGYITFRNIQLEQSVLAIDFTNTNGTKLSQNSSTSTLDTSSLTPSNRLLKTANDLPISTATEAGYQRELKTFYRVGQTQIVRDNGRGNFFLKTLDKNRAEVGAALSPQQLYPDTIEVDFENGIFRLDKPFNDPDIYAENPTTKYTFQLEYSFRLRTFFLEPNLVVQSETVLIDGRRQNRNVDYFIDYDSGFITFFNDDRIRADSVIDITYEVAPFGGLGTSSLLGMRAQWNFNEHWKIGSTLLYESGTKSPTTPSVTDLAKSLLVYELDSQLKDISLFGVKTNLAFEVAQSRLNPNLNGFALIDNMEGVKEQSSAIIDQNFWFPSANPTGSTIVQDPTALNLQNEDINVLTINPNAQANANETQKVMQMNFDFNVSSEVSVVQRFSDAGLDFSQKVFLELTLLAEFPGDNGPAVNIHLGQISEDADGTGGVTLNCASGATLLGQPKTEDLNCDGVLSSAEDIGWTFSPAGKNAKQIGVDNGRLDSADLDNDGRLDSEDIFSGASFGYAGGGYSTFTITGGIFNETLNSTQTFLNTSGGSTRWHVFQIPLNIVSTDTARWSAIKQVRLSLREQPGGAKTGVVKIARLAVTGNSWKVPSYEVGTGTISVNGVNNVDNPSYVPIFNAGGDALLVFEDLYGGISEQRQRTNTSNLQEQALSLQASDLSAGAFGSTKRVFSREIDIAQHKQLRFLFYPEAAPTTDVDLVFRAGDQNNFQEAAIPLKNLGKGWRLVALDLVDLNKDQIPDLWANASAFPVSVVSSGAVNFQQLSEIKVGLRNKTGTTACAGTGACEVFINEIHLTDPRTRVGNARKAEASFDIPGWMDFGGRYRFIDRNFQTPTSPITNRDDEQESAYLNLKRLSFLPMSFNFSRQRTVTPNTNKTGINDLVSLLEQDEVVKRSGDASANFTYGALPRLGFKYSRNFDQFLLLAREDDKRNYDGTFSYGLPLNWRILPKSVDATYTRAETDVRFTDAVKRAAQGNFETAELAQTYTGRGNWQPWDGSSLNPEYRLKRAEELRRDFAGTPTEKRYNKNLEQTASFSSNWKLLKWFNPSIRYSVTTVETNNLTVSTVTVGTSSKTFDLGQVKTINRTGTGGVNLTLNMRDILPKWEPVRTLTLNNSYTLNDADFYENVEDGFESRGRLWIREPLKPANAFAERKTQTLQDRYSSNQRWSPFEAFEFKRWWRPWRTLSLSNNYTQSIERRDTTGTKSKTISKTLPDLIVSLQQVERLFFIRPDWMTNSQLSVKYQKRRTDNIEISVDKDRSVGFDLRFLLKRFMDTSLSFNHRLNEKEDLRLAQITETTKHRDASVQGSFDVGKFRFTPKVDYAFDQKVLGTGVISSETTQLIPSLLVRADLNLPSGLKIPFLNRTLIFTNRIIWTTNAAFTRKRSPVAQADNTDLFNLTTSGDYEIAKNLRMTMNGSIQRLWHKFLEEEDYISYQFGSTLTFQF